MTGVGDLRRVHGKIAALVVLALLAGACSSPAQARTSRLAPPSALPSVSPSPSSELPPDILARIPKFPPAPPPAPATVPAGKLQQAGAVIEAHTISHRNLRGASYAVQKHEICGSADKLGQLYGRRPVLFRPPFGEQDATMLRVVHDCGMHAAFFWKETTDKGIVRYQSPVHRVQPGDVVLMHFRPAFVDDFLGVLAAVAQSGLTPALLEDYVYAP